MLTLKNLTGALIAIGVTPTLSKEVANGLYGHCFAANITSPNKVGGLLGQTAVESTMFTVQEESLYYTTMARMSHVFGSRAITRPDLLRNPKGLANFVYANRLGNGSEASGDGWKYRGSSWIQLSGKANYMEAKAYSGLDVVSNPELLRTDKAACAKVSIGFFVKNGCVELAENAKWDAVTRAVNGPKMLEAAKRARLSKTAANYLIANWAA